jgi:muramidase (phage lysozyme)
MAELAEPFDAPESDDVEAIASAAPGAGAPARRGRTLPVVGPGGRLILDRLSDAEGTDEARARARGYGSGYDVLFGYRPNPGPRPLSEMTLEEVDGLQGTMGDHTPVGRYQVTRATLRGLRDAFGLRGTTVFTPALQDQIGRQLMRRRGYDNPRLSPDEVQSRFALEWASVPTLNGTSTDPRQPVGMNGRAFQQYLAQARAMDGIR